MTPILDALSQIETLKQVPIKTLKALAQELRLRIIHVVSQTGGHLASNLGIVELTIALHRVFESPKDTFIFDVGHQSYVHKLLTGRNGDFPSLRQTKGLSGFTDPEESPHDHFYAGHAGNALSLALGVAKSRDLQQKEHAIIPILGDASLTCGLTLEALNNIPPSLKKFIIVLNDNAMSISKNVGAIPHILNGSFKSSAGNALFQALIKQVDLSSHFNRSLLSSPPSIEQASDHLIAPSLFFEQFGLAYVGPIDGHNMEELLSTFEELKHLSCPTLVHVLTTKGQGMEKAMNNPTPYHGAAPFNPTTGTFHLKKRKETSFPKIFGSYLYY